MTMQTAWAGLLVLVLTLAGTAVPGASAQTLYLPPEQQETWAAELADAQRNVEAARQRLAEAEAEYSRARHDQYPRGAEMAKLEREFRDAQSDLPASEKALEALVEQARQAGVLPEVLRPYR